MEIFLVNRPVVPVMTKMRTAKVISAKSTVSPTRSCDHFTCFSLGTLSRSPLGRACRNHPNNRKPVLAWGPGHRGNRCRLHSRKFRIITWRTASSGSPATQPGITNQECRLFLPIQLRPDHVLLQARVHFESGLEADRAHLAV